MKKILLFVPFILLSSCSQIGVKEDQISLYNDKSRLYIDKLEENESCLLKTYHHKKYGDVPYVALDEYCETFDKTVFKAKQKYAYVDGKFVVSGNNGGGSCVISMLSNSSGYLYHSSSEWTSLLSENGEYITNDYGVEPDIKIDASKFYDHQYIDQLLAV